MVYAGRQYPSNSQYRLLWDCYSEVHRRIGDG